MKKIIIGPIGSGKTTIYRKLNEENKAKAVEIELPQSCIKDEQLKKKLFLTFYKNKNIDTIIVHPYYLTEDFKKIIRNDDIIEFINLPFEERLDRIVKRSASLKVECKIFDNNYLIQEEEDFRQLKKEIEQWKSDLEQTD